MKLFNKTLIPSTTKIHRFVCLNVVTPIFISKLSNNVFSTIKYQR